MAELWPVFFHEIVEERLDFAGLAAELEECGLPLFLLMMVRGRLIRRGEGEGGTGEEYPESSGCSFGHDFGGGQTSEREDEEVGNVRLDLRVEECVEEDWNELFG